ncbi:transferrin [Helicoverpa armigera]|uniref:transferrin n=1 Tax=Helicoverpa armigera TaxID=29058 RepID=UPI003082EF76
MASKIKYIYLLVLACVCVQAKLKYKICVPLQHIKLCQKMVNTDTQSKTQIECVAARDRVECLSLVQQRQADIVPVDPEDMYCATKLPNEDFVLIQEYRTDDEPDAPFRYEAVIVVHNDLPINNLDQLKGLKSCHTGVGRNVGYKIPLTMLMKRSVFPKMNDHSISPRENELKALSTFFSKSCIVGKWSPDPKTNSAWKSQYNQLCSMCEHPDKCDYPDNYSGYEGALRCLATNGGQVAFTKVIYVRKFFGLPVGNIPAGTAEQNPDGYSYLCVDGSKVPIKSKACSWAARPWQGLLAHNDVLANLAPLREKLNELARIGGRGDTTDWFTNVLGMSTKMRHIADVAPIRPLEYLNKANYTEVIERGHGPPEHVVRLCVTSNVARAKCQAMSTFAFSRDIRPRLDCVQQATQEDCLKSVQDNGSDLASVDDMRVMAAVKKYNLHPVFHEVYGDAKIPNYAVAVVKKGTSFNKIEDLRGHRSCHDNFRSFSGFYAPMYYLINKQVINHDQCIKNFASFFSAGSCIPGINDPENNPKGDDVSKLTQQCSTDSNPLSCLSEDRGDVAFVSSAELPSLDASQYELLCLNREAGGRDSLANYATCNIAMAPSRTWVAAKDFQSDVSIAHTPLALAQLLDTRTDLFNIYGEFLKNNDVIFHNAARGLATTEKMDFEKFKQIHDVISNCGNA